MIKNNLFYRIVAIFLLVPILFSILPPIESYAADTVYMETLVNEENKTYSTSVMADTFKKNKKYDYKYIQMSAYIKDVCGLKSGEINANKCYSLGETLGFIKDNGSTEVVSERSKWISYTAGDVTSADFFIKSEGFFGEGGGLKTVSKGEPHLKLFPNGDAKSGFFLDSSANKEILITEWPSDPSGKDGTPKENDYAVKVSSTLTSSLNQLLNLVNGGGKYPSVESLINRSILIRPLDLNNIAKVSSIASSTNSTKYLIVYAENDIGSAAADANSIDSAKKALLGKAVPTTFTTSTEFFENTGLPKTDEAGNLLMYIFEFEDIKDKNGNSKVDIYANDYSLSTSSTKGTLKTSSMSSLVYAMPKGYAPTPGGTILFPDASGKAQSIGAKDIPYITIHMLAQRANALYKQYGMSVSSVDHVNEEGIATSIIVKAFNDIINTILAALQITPINELVYNGGLRNSSTYNYGTMSDNWWQVVVKYHLIFQAIAWFIIIIGFLKTLIGLNVSTVNPGKTESLYNSVQKFIITGFLLVLIIPAAQFMMSLNSSIVGIFASQVDTSLAGAPILPGIGGIFISLVFVGIDIYINFIYVMRSITIALLIISAPFFIATLSITGTSRATMFTSWLKELIANIFLQSVHAFSLAFLISLVQSGTLLENIVISFSIIPITEMFRALILAGGAGTTEGMAKQAAAGATAMTAGVVSGIANGGAGAIARLASAGDKPEGDAASSLEKDGSATGGAGGKRGADNAGFGALTQATNSSISKLKESGLKDFREGSGGKGKLVGAAAMTAAKGIAKGAAGMAGMATNMAMSQFSGRSDGFGAAGAIAGSMGGGLLGAVADTAKEGIDHHRAPTSYDNEDTKASKDELAGLRATDTEPVIESGASSASKEGLANAANNQSSPSNMMAQKLQAAIGGGTDAGAAENWLAYKGITNVKADGKGGASFFVGSARGSEVATRRKDNITTSIHDLGAGRTYNSGDKQHPRATCEMSKSEFDNWTKNNPAAEAKFGPLKNSISNGGSGEFSGGSMDVSGDKVKLNFDGVLATSDNKRLMSSSMDGSVPNFYSMNHSARPEAATPPVGSFNDNGQNGPENV